MKQKLIVLTEALWVGGIETALLHLLQALDGTRYDITVLILRPEAPLAHRLPRHCRLLTVSREDPGYRFGWLSRLTAPPSRPSRRHQALSWLVPGLKWLESGLFTRFLGRKLAGERFDTAIVYSDAAAFAVDGVRARRYLLFYHHGALRRTYRDGKAWKRSGRIIAVSRHQAAALGAFRPRYAEKITAIPNLVDGAAVKQGAFAFSPGFLPDTFHIVTCARLHRDKGIDLAVAAAGMLQIPQDWHWWIIGGGPEAAALQGQIRALGLEGRMTLLGMQENPYPYMAACDLYVQPSRVESCPMSIMEALILGKPVLSADNPGARERLAEGKYGLLCEGTPAAIAAGVQLFYRQRPSFPAWDWGGHNRAAREKLEQLLWEGLCQESV